MKVTEKMFDQAVSEEIISAQQADRLIVFFKTLPSAGPVFDFTHVLYYMGGLVAIGAMTLFMNLGWENFGGWGILLISLLYGGAGLKMTGYFRNKGYAIPAGISATFVVALTPLAIYGLQQAMGWWPADSVYNEYHRYIRWHWIYMELGTLAAGAIVMWAYRFPFLQMPIAITLWYMSMDLAAMLAGGTPDFELRTLVSMYFGILMILFAFWVDFRSAESGDYAFWLYLFGVMTFWGGLTFQESDSEISKFMYLCINLLLIGVGVTIVRRVFLVFGAFGCAVYLGHLAYDVFEDSWFFPIALTAIGLGIIFVGICWQKHEEKVTRSIQRRLPGPLREFLSMKTNR